MKRYLFFTAAVALVAALALSLVGRDGQTQAAGGAELISVYGEVPGTDLNVHITVVVRPGETPDQAAAAALRAQGARPIQSAEFTTTGLVWDQFSDDNGGNDFVTQNYIN